MQEVIWYIRAQTSVCQFLRHPLVMDVKKWDVTRLLRELNLPQTDEMITHWKYQIDNTPKAYLNMLQRTLRIKTEERIREQMRLTEGARKRKRSED